MRPPAGRRGRRPLRKGRSVSIFCRGGCQPPESLPPLRGKVPPKGADEGAFLACTLPGGRPKGLPYPIPEEFLESRRGGRLPLSRGDVERSETKGIGNCPSRLPRSSFFCRAREGELPRRGKRSWPGPRPGAPSFPFRGVFRRLRAATNFAHSGKVGKTLPGDAADGLRLRFAPPRSIGPLSPGPPTYGGHPFGAAVTFRHVEI